MADIYTYSGAIHIHSTYSDGSKSISEIAKIADSLKMDYILIADHNTLEGKDNGHEGIYGKTRVIIGYEINDPHDENLNHYLAFRIDKTLPAEFEPKEYVKGVKEKGGIGFIAHPHEVRGDIIKDFPGNPWVEWDVEGYDGIEIWNQMSEWMERLTNLNKLWMIVSPRKGIYQPSKETLSFWDKINLEKRISGIGGIDVHAMPYKIGPITLVFFPYKVQFQSIRTNIVLKEPLTGIFKNDKEKIYQALKRGNSYIYNMRWGKIDVNPFSISSENELLLPGDEHIYDPDRDYELNIEMPKKSLIKILRNGEEILNKKSIKFNHKIQKSGNYRIEAYVKNHGWLFTNNIYLKDKLKKDKI